MSMRKCPVQIPNGPEIDQVQSDWLLSDQAHELRTRTLFLKSAAHGRSGR